MAFFVRTALFVLFWIGCAYATANYTISVDSLNKTIVVASTDRPKYNSALPKLTTIRLSSFINPATFNYAADYTVTANNHTSIVVRILWLTNSDRLSYNFYDYFQSVGGVNVGLERLASERVLSKYPNVDLEVAHAASMANGGCSASGDLNTVHQIYDTLQYNFDAVIGPPCGEGALAVTTFVESVGKSPINWAAAHQDFDMKSRYPHVTQTYVDIFKIGECCVEFLRQLGNWKRIAFLYDSESYSCSTLLWQTFRELARQGAKVNGFTMAYTAMLSGSKSTDDEIRATLSEAKAVARIIMTCTTTSASKTGYGPAQRYDKFNLRILSQAYRLGIHTGEYQWMLLRVALQAHHWPPYAPLQTTAIELLNANYSMKPVIDELKLPVSEEELYLMYHSVVDFDQQWGSEHTVPSKQIVEAAFVPPWNADRQVFDSLVKNGVLIGQASTFSSHVADIIYMYGRGVRNALDRELDYSNGTIMYKIFQNISFEGQSGYYAINEQGKRLGDLLVYAPVANYYQTHPLKRIGRRGMFRCAWLSPAERAAGMKGKLDVTSPLEWFGTLNNLPPPDTPVCGWNNENCRPLSTTGIVLVSVAGALFVAIIALALSYVRRRKLRLAALNNTDWNLQASDLVWTQTTSSVSRRGSAFSGTTLEENQSDIGLRGSFGTILTAAESIDSKPWRHGKPTVMFRDKLNVYVKPLYIESSPNAAASSKPKARKSIINILNLPIESLRELRAMKDADHDNINRFVGVVTSMAQADAKNYAATAVPTMLVVTANCSKGNLTSVLYASSEDEVPLDWLFKYSFMCDIANGVQYMHYNSALKWHGRLSSSTVVLDARWTAKLTDFGLWTFGSHGLTRDLLALVHNKRGTEKLLWTAPEVLRNPNILVEDYAVVDYYKSRQAADIYSFGVMMSEIIYQTFPYSAEQDVGNLTVSDIINMLVKSDGESSKEIRPEHGNLFSVSAATRGPHTAFNEQQRKSVTLTSREQLESALAARQLMIDCWQETALERPNIRQIVRRLRIMNRDGGSESIVDRIINKLEVYAENLEAVVRDRTSELMDEKQRADALLSRMLPASVTERLKLGKPVIPEYYEEATIFFSDIVSFTSVSSMLAPMQVVQLLNDLYTFMDGTLERYAPLVYKVETIGDAYMIVSGVPLRTQMHARILASVALNILANIANAVRISHVVIDPTTRQPMQHVRIRIGLNSGPCVAGDVGLQMPRYCLFGDTVNVASRMESNSEPMRIHISTSTREALKLWSSYVMEERGIVEIKGKGSMNTFWLVDGPLILT